MEFHGSDGIPRQGHENEYATQLWLEGPSAFWLHPEGPLSETTPEEWLERARLAEEQARASRLQNPLYAYAQAGMLHSASALQAYQNAYNYQRAAGLSAGLVGALLGSGRG